MNFNPNPVAITLDGGTYQNTVTGEPVSGKLELAGYGIQVLKA